MFLQRYNPWGKTKRDQLQSWNILTFDPQKTDVDEHIDLINTLGNMLGQTAESKKEKFVDTMPTIIQTHLITCKTWAKTTKKAKELEHIIRRCDPPAAALPNLTEGTAVPSLYSHIAHSNDKEETDIPQPFKGARPKQPKARDRGKGKQPQQKLKPSPVQVQEDQYTYEDTNNYYHNENYRGQPRGCKPYRGQNVETMPHAMYFSGSKETFGKINQVPYQIIEYDDKGMFQAKLMDNTQLQIFIDNGATPSSLPLSIYNKYSILQKYPKTQSHSYSYRRRYERISFLDRNTFEIR